MERIFISACNEINNKTFTMIWRERESKSLIWPTLMRLDKVSFASTKRKLSVWIGMVKWLLSLQVKWTSKTWKHSRHQPRVSPLFYSSFSRVLFRSYFFPLLQSVPKIQITDSTVSVPYKMPHRTRSPQETREWRCVLSLCCPSMCILFVTDEIKCSSSNSTKNSHRL